MKKFISLLLFIILIISLSACVSKPKESININDNEDEETVALPNPITDINKEDFDKAIGFESSLPESSTDITYQHIDSVEIFQVNFTYEDNKYTFRFSKVSDDISGYYYEWDIEEDFDNYLLQYYSNENAGVTTWEKDNFSFCLSSSTASKDSLIDTTNFFIQTYC